MKANPSPAKRYLPHTLLDYFGLAAMVLLLLCSLVLFIRLVTIHMLANRYLLLIMAVLLVLNTAHVIVQVPLRRNKLGKLICGVLAIVLSVAMLWTMSAAGSVQSALTRISSQLVEKDVIAVIVLEDNPAQTIDDAVGYSFGYVDGLDSDNTNNLIAHLRERLGIIPTRASSSQTALVDDLYDGNVDAIILNTGYISILGNSEEYADFSSQTRILYEYTISREVSPTKRNVNISREPFVVYCSGIDARNSDVSATANSDVNILAVVNPDTHQLLLLNTPRDYYVPLHMNGYLDKLTHAGIYGIDESIATLSDLYGIEISSYVRVNFMGLVDIVDALGGVDVESPMEFTTTAMEMPTVDNSGFVDESFYFPAGTVHLSGREALAFSRERYAFVDGDNQRGRNQMAVIRGIVDKATSSAILSNYQALLTAVAKSCITNISYPEIAAAVQMQQHDASPWNVVSYAVSGYGDSAICYSYPDYELYVTQPDYDTVETAKNLIHQVLSGETPVVPEE